MKSRPYEIKRIIERHAESILSSQEGIEISIALVYIDDYSFDLIFRVPAKGNEVEELNYTTYNDEGEIITDFQFGESALNMIKLALTERINELRKDEFEEAMEFNEDEYFENKIEIKWE